MFDSLLGRFTYSAGYKVFCAVLLYCGCQCLVAKELILSAPPRENAAEGRKIFQPFAAKLSEILGRKVSYQHPHGWLSYQRDMRNGVYDLVFDGPHFASWRIEHLGHRAVVKLPGTLSFHLLTDKNFSDIQKSKDLIGKKSVAYRRQICPY